MDSAKKTSRRGTPDSPWYTAAYYLSRIFLFFKARLRVEKDGFSLPDGPAVYLANHPSPLDYFQTAGMIWPRRIICIACSLDLTLDEHYRFKENEYGWHRIADLYKALEERERREMPDGSFWSWSFSFPHPPPRRSL